MTDYAAFLERKSQLGGEHGFAPVWMPDFLFDFQASLVEWALRKGRAAIFADCGLGKLHPVSEPVLTPDGWRPIGALKIGDAVMGSAGLPVRVLGVFPQGVQEVVRVTFSDGAMSRCGWEHLWTVQSQNDRTRGQGTRVLTTRELLAQGLTYGHARHSRQWSVPLVAPISGSDAGCRIDGYALGVILGDGSISTRGYVTLTTDRCILDALGVVGRLRAHRRTAWVAVLSTGMWAVALREYGLAGRRSHEKFVPSAYFEASPAMRLAVLQGLMDTDGSPLSDGGTEFSSTSEALTDAVVMLARSLGGVARKKGPRVTRYRHHGVSREGKPSWRVNLKLPTGVCPFRLGRKAERYVAPSKYQPVRLIESIEAEGVEEESVCILVDAPDHLYITRDYILTHNTPMQLVWAENIVRRENRPVLILTPLAVSYQTLREAEKFGIDVVRSQDGAPGRGITVTNYERLQHFKPDDFMGVVCDESSILKSFDGVRRGEITEFMRKVPYRLLCTATAAPNDYVELGTSSEALGELGHMDMLNRFFKNQNNTSDTKGRWRGHAAPRVWEGKQWRFKGHAERPFWRWVCSWARAVRRPSDLGFDDGAFVLPTLTEREHVVNAETLPDGMLFSLPAVGLQEQREERRRTIKERCEMIAVLVAKTKRPALVWCHLNAEGNLLGELIHDGKQVSGDDSDDAKEDAFLAFANGQQRVLITKPKIGAWGLNFQHCSHVLFFPSHSFEQYYQGVRRCWRYGQTRPVVVDVVTTEGDQDVLKNLRRKAAAADRMFSHLVDQMQHAEQIGRTVSFPERIQVPTWVAS